MATGPAAGQELAMVVPPAAPDGLTSVATPLRVRSTPLDAAEEEEQLRQDLVDEEVRLARA